MLTGRAIAGPLEGSALELAPDAYVAFWFAWSPFIRMQASRRARGRLP